MGLHDGHRQRKRERFLKQGADGLADHEVLELLCTMPSPAGTPTSWPTG